MRVSTGINLKFTVERFVNYFGHQFIPGAYIKQCSRQDPNLTECVVDTIHHLKPYLSNGIPDIDVSRKALVKKYIKDFQNID